MKLRIATRRSKLALVQSRWVGAQLEKLQPGLSVELFEMVTQGDRIQDVSLAEIGGKGLFVSEIETALLDGRADLAVHSLKDVPAQLAAGLCLAAVPLREDPRDVLVALQGEQLDDLEAGSRIGTNSLRRSLQLGRLRPDLDYAMLRGNVDTRLAKLERGEYRAIVLAMAGLNRLGLAGRPLWVIPAELSVPAVGQGALAIEARSDAPEVLALLQQLEDPASRLCVEAERSFLKTLGGDCTTPLAGHARLLDGGARLRFDGWVGDVTGKAHVRASSESFLRGGVGGLDEARGLGEEVARNLLSEGAAALIEGARRAPDRDPRRPVG
jgi:hydroxymethylbilane synthase